EASRRYLRCHFDIGKDLDVTAAPEEIWLPRAEVGIAIFATEQPVLSQLPLHAAAGRPTGPPRAVGLRMAKEASRTCGAVADQSGLDPLKRQTTGAIDQNVGGHQEARTQPQAEVIFVFDTRGVKGRSTWSKEGASERAAAQEALNGAGL